MDPNNDFFWGWGRLLWKTRLPAVRNDAFGRVGERESAHRYNVAVAFVIREFKPEDFDVLWRMDQECFPPGNRLFQAGTQVLRESPGTVHPGGRRRKDGKVAGFIVVHERPTGHVITIDVIPRCAARASGRCC